MKKQIARASILFMTLAAFSQIMVSQASEDDIGIRRLRYVTILVRNYDEALNWYTKVLGMEKTEDGTFGNGQRWLVVAPHGRKEIGIVLEIAKPYSPGSNLASATASDSIRDYESRIGKETRWVFEVEDCKRFYEAASKRGVKFVEAPVEQAAWGVTEAMFEDLYGNVFVVESFKPKPTR